MSLYTERHGMRTPIEKTDVITITTYSLLYDCCSEYFEYLAWKYPEECPDGCGCCGMDYEKFNENMQFEIPALFRRSGSIAKPRSTHNVFGHEETSDKYDQYALFDLIEFVAQNVRDIKSRNYHSFFRHNHLIFGSTNNIAQTFVEEINDIFQKTGLLYHLTANLEVERIEEVSVLSDKIADNIAKIDENGIKELLTTAIQKHTSPHPDDQKYAVEKIWDAFERLKTYYQNLDKKGSAAQIIDDMSGGVPEYMDLFDAEFRALTTIGNSFRIRHHETNKIDIVDIRHYDYFFNRCLSLIATAILYLKQNSTNDNS